MCHLANENHQLRCGEPGGDTDLALGGHLQARAQSRLLCLGCAAKAKAKALFSRLASVARHQLATQSPTPAITQPADYFRYAGLTPVVAVGTNQHILVAEACLTESDLKYPLKDTSRRAYLEAHSCKRYFVLPEGLIYHTDMSAGWEVLSVPLARQDLHLREITA